MVTQSFKRFTAENFPNGFVDDAVDCTSVEHTSDKTQYDLLIKETPESRFTNITLEYLESLSESDSQSRATINLITYIAYESDAECFVEGLEEGESLAEAIHSYVKWTTSIEGLNNFLDEQIDNAKQDDYLDEFGIDSTGALDYIDVESFLRDIDYDFVINAIKSCWNRVSNNHIK